VDQLEGDRRVRLAAFDFLAGHVAVRGDVLPRSLLAEGFVHNSPKISGVEASRPYPSVGHERLFPHAVVGVNRSGPTSR
jgi:hypothetical protein